MSDYTELVKKLRDLHRDPRPASAEWLFENQVALYDAAAAIEELQALLTEADKKQTYQHDCICELTAENEELQAEADELKQKNTDLLNVREVSNDDMERILEALRNIPVGPIESIVEQLPKQRNLVEVVRCKDCYWNQIQRFGNGKEYCECSRGNSRINNGDWFCPEGEKMEVQE